MYDSTTTKMYLVQAYQNFRLHRSISSIFWYTCIPFPNYIPHSKGPVPLTDEHKAYAKRTPKFQGWHQPFSSTLKIDKTVENLKKTKWKKNGQG